MCIVTAGMMTTYFTPACPVFFTAFGTWLILNKHMLMTLNTATPCAAPKIQGQLNQPYTLAH